MKSYCKLVCNSSAALIAALASVGSELGKVFELTEGQRYKWQTLARFKCPSAPRVVICIKCSPFAPTGTVVTSATQHRCGIIRLREKSCLRRPSLSKLTLWAISQVGLWCHMWPLKYLHTWLLFLLDINNVKSSLKYGGMSSWKILNWNLRLWCLVTS